MKLRFLAIVAAFAVVALISLGWGTPGVFPNLPSALIVVCIPIALGVGSFGWGRVAQGLSSVRVLFWREEQLEAAAIRLLVLKALRSWVYFAAVLGVLVGLVQVLGSGVGSPETTALAIATTMETPVYGILLAEFLLSPTIETMDSSMLKA